MSDLDPARCCDLYDPTDPEAGVGEPDDLHVVVCRHMLDPRDSRYTYSPDEVEPGVVLVRLIEPLGGVAEHGCADPDCERVELCAHHWGNL